MNSRWVPGAFVVGSTFLAVMAERWTTNGAWCFTAGVVAAGVYATVEILTYTPTRRR